MQFRFGCQILYEKIVIHTASLAAPMWRRGSGWDSPLVGWPAYPRLIGYWVPHRVSQLGFRFIGLLLKP